MASPQEPTPLSTPPPPSSSALVEAHTGSPSRTLPALKSPPEAAAHTTSPAPSPSSYSPLSTSLVLPSPVASSSNPAHGPPSLAPPPSAAAFTLPEAWGTLESQNPHTATSYVMLKSAIIIGRGKESDLRVPAILRSVSNKHCMIAIGRELDVDGTPSPWFPYITDYRLVTPTSPKTHHTDSFPYDTRKTKHSFTTNTLSLC